MPKFVNNLSPRLNRLARIIFASISMFVIGVAINMQRVSEVGLAPWNALNDGISKTFGITFGQASIIIGFLVIIIDLVMKESIGVGTLLDALLVGTATDIIASFDFIPYYKSYLYRFPLFIAGLTLLCYGQYLYMSTALSCGPRDAFSVAVGKKCRKMTAGTVFNIIFAVVLLIAWALGGSIGIGTVISVFLNGKIMDTVFAIVNFEPRDIIHEDIISTVRVLITNK